MHILIVDQDRRDRIRLARALKAQSYRVTAIDNPDMLPMALGLNKPDVVLLDVAMDMPDSGLDVCRSLRNWSAIPVIMVSDTVSESFDEKNKIEALDAGADDVLIAPFSFEELLARLRAIQRRLDHVVHTTSPLLQFGDLSVDLASSQVLLGTEIVHLTRNEFKLLKALIAADGKPVTYRNLLASVYGREGEMKGQNATVRGLVQQLRSKLNHNLGNPGYILTEARLGYRFNMNPRVILSVIDEDDEIGNQRTV